jgi:hypothetical protein
MSRISSSLIVCLLLTGCWFKPIIEETPPEPTPAPEVLPTPIPTPTPKPPVRERIINEASSYVGIKETNGANRSKIIDQMNKFTGAPMGSPWCASFNAWVYKNAEVPQNWPKSAWSPDWVRNATWTRSKKGMTPKAGDSFGIYFQNKNRVAHTGLIKEWGDKVVLTIEGNTGPTGSVGEADRNGDGCYMKRRLPSQIYSVRNWVDTYGTKP